MPFKWLKRRRNTLAAGTPPPSIPPPLPSPRHSHFATQQRTVSAPYPQHGHVQQPSTPGSAPSTPSEAPKIRRRKSFFQTIGLAKDKDKERKRASSFTHPPKKYDPQGAPPVPPLPNGATTPIASQFAPPRALDPAPSKRKSLIPRKAPPSAWGGDATPAGAPTPPVPAPALPVPSPSPSAKTNAAPPPSGVGLGKPPRMGPLGSVQLDDMRGGELPDSPPDLRTGQFSALDALDRLDAIGTLELGSSMIGSSAAPQPAPSPSRAQTPSSFGGQTLSRRTSMPSLDKPLPSPGLAPPATSKRKSLDPRVAGVSGRGLPEVDRPAIRPPSGMALGGELPPPPTRGARKSTTPEAFEAQRNAGASVRTASSTSADTALAPSTYRKPPPSDVAMVPSSDILNRPKEYGVPRVGVESAVSSPARREKEGEESKEAPKPAKTAPSQPVRQPEPEPVVEPVATPSAPQLPPVAGGPAIQVAMDGAGNKHAPEPKSEATPASEAATKAEPEREASRAPLAPEPEEIQPVARNLPFMGGPAKIQGVLESSYTYQKQKAQEEAEKREQDGAKDEDKEDQPKDAGKEGETEEKASDEGKEAKAAGDKVADEEAGLILVTEEIADNVSEAASDLLPITTERLGHARNASTSTWGASTEQLVDRPGAELRVSVDAPRPNSAFIDRPVSGYDNPHNQYLSTPPRLPSTQTFGSLPATTTFGSLPRPMSVVSRVDEDEDEREVVLSPVAESETGQDAPRASVPDDEITPKVTPLPVTPPRLPAILPPSPGVPELYTPDATPPSHHIHTPAPSEGFPEREPFKATRSVSTPSKPSLSRSLGARPGGSPEREKQIARIPSAGNLRPVQRQCVTSPMPAKTGEAGGTDEEPTLDDFMTLFRHVQNRGQGVGIRKAAAAAEGREFKERRPYGIELEQPAAS